MNKLEVGQNYTANRFRNGQSAKGAWELIVTTDAKGKNEITIFPRNNPSGVHEGQQFNLESIQSINFGFRMDKNNRWQPNCSIEAIVHPIESEFDTGIVGGNDDVWAELEAKAPWDEDDMPL